MNKFSVGDIVIPRRVPTGYPVETTPALEKLIGVSAPVVAVWANAVCCHGFIWQPECVDLATVMEPEREIVIRKMPCREPQDVTPDGYAPGWHVQEGDRYADGLCWDEMLGTVAEMTMCNQTRAWLKTAEGHRKEREAWRQRPGIKRVWVNVYCRPNGYVFLGIARDTEASAKENINPDSQYLMTIRVEIPLDLLPKNIPQAPAK